MWALLLKIKTKFSIRGFFVLGISILISFFFRGYLKDFFSLDLNSLLDYSLIVISANILNNIILAILDFDNKLMMNASSSENIGSSSTGGSSSGGSSSGGSSSGGKSTNPKLYKHNLGSAIIKNMFTPEDQKNLDLSKVLSDKEVLNLEDKITKSENYIEKLKLQIDSEKQKIKNDNLVNIGSVSPPLNSNNKLSSLKAMLNKETSNLKDLNLQRNNKIALLYSKEVQTNRKLN